MTRIEEGLVLTAAETLNAFCQKYAFRMSLGDLVLSAIALREGWEGFELVQEGTGTIMTSNVPQYITSETWFILVRENGRTNEWLTKELNAAILCATHGLWEGQEETETSKIGCFLVVGAVEALDSFCYDRGCSMSLRDLISVALAWREERCLEYSPDTGRTRIAIENTELYDGRIVQVVGPDGIDEVPSAILNVAIRDKIGGRWE